MVTLDAVSTAPLLPAGSPGPTPCAASAAPGVTMFFVFNQPGTFSFVIAVDGSAIEPLVGDGGRQPRPRGTAAAPPGGRGEE